MRRRKLVRRALWILTVIFTLMNVIAFFQAYKFTHFSSSNTIKTPSPEKLTTIDKVKTIFFGVNNPRPTNSGLPSKYFETVKLKSNKTIECWDIKASGAKGTVILFHGYSGQKSSMLNKSDEFINEGYNTLLVDFMGSGGSDGNQTTIGYKEAEEVKTAFDYISKKGEKNIYLFGTSMGAVAILKAIQDYGLTPKGIIVECPFGSMYQTTCARFNIIHVPTFPMAGLLVFWGGIQNDFWAFGHNPVEYAKAVKCPTLLLYGEQDNRVSRQEIDEIYKNLNCKKVLRTYPLAGHEDYLQLYKRQWTEDIHNFLHVITK
jgi:alpha-beta hydrolase superfamily lysophospholipase